MSIPTGGLAALLVVATLAVTGCGSDDGTATATTVVTVPANAAQTTTQQQTTTAKAPSTTTQAAPSTTTQKTQTTTSAAPAKPASAPAKPRLCESIGVGLRDGDVDTTYARITQLNKITCAGASTIVAQWGQQQIGIDKALLPVGWECTKANVCSSGKQSVAFALEYPQE